MESITELRGSFTRKVLGVPRRENYSNDGPHSLTPQPESDEKEMAKQRPKWILNRAFLSLSPVHSINPIFSGVGSSINIKLH